jgi:hypothetical protein
MSKRQPWDPPKGSCPACHWGKLQPDQFFGLHFKCLSCGKEFTQWMLERIEAGEELPADPLNTPAVFAGVDWSTVHPYGFYPATQKIWRQKP